mgnify:FL=1
MNHEAADVCTDFELFLLELQRIPEQEFTRTRVQALLTSFAGRRLYLPRRTLVRPHQVKMAAHLMRSGLTRAEAARQLSNHLDVSESTAYRIIARALQLPPPGHQQLGMFQ